MIEDLDGRPAVTIVLATYNRPRALRCAIHSVIGQTFHDWELIVVGDSCTPATGAVVESFADPRIRYVNLSRNFGEQSGPNNFGVSLGSAPLVAFLNHDDVWLPEHLRRCFERLQAERADLVFGAAAYIAEQTPLPVRLDELFIAIRGAGGEKRWSPASVEDSAVPASSWLLRRKMFDEIGGWRMGRDTFADPSQDFLFRAWKAGYHLRGSGDLTVVMTTSGRRSNSYLGDHATEQEWILERISNPDFAVELAALAYESNESFAIRTRRRTEPLARLAGRLLAAIGWSPRALYFRTRHRFGPGDYIKKLRQTRGLPVLQRPRSSVAQLRFDMVKQGCTIRLPTTVSFGVGRGGARHLADGWSRPEPSGVWTDGPEATLLFGFDEEPTAPLILELELHPFGLAQHLVVRVGTEEIATLPCTPDTTRHSVTIPVALCARSLLDVTLVPSDPHSPESVGESGDPRHLGVRLVEATISSSSLTAEA